MNAVPAPWQQRAFEQGIAALEGGHMGHALLICGPERLGKRAVAERLAAHLLGADGDARAAHLIAAGSHPDLHLLGLEFNKEGTRLRTEIVIDQIRALSSKLSLTPQYGGVQVAIIDPADAINHAACNGLLKTLEEPQPGRYLWLVASHPARLPATIRSRCQRLEFRLPPRAEALAWLRAQGHPEADAVEALDATRGHPGLADDWLRHGGMALRKQVVQDLSQLSRSDASVLETAQRWVADDALGARLGHAADLALREASGLTDPLRTRKLAGWFDAANRARDLLQRSTVRADLAVAELLMEWRGMRAEGARR